MTRLNDKDKAALMVDMKSFDEPMPSVGSFSFDPVQKALINVRKIEITPKRIEDARAKGIRVVESLAQLDDRSVLGGSIRWNTAYQKDRQRDNLLTNHGFQVLRFSSIDIYNDLQGCINQIEDSFSNFQHGRVVYHRNGGLGYFGANI